MSKIRVFIVDDSVMVRKLFSDTINAHKDMEVAGTAVDAVMAKRKLSVMDVDVILLDIDMPKVNGLEYLSYIMSHTPTPVIICSNLVEDRNGKSATRALELGAVELITKNDIKIKDFISNSSTKLINAIISASKSKVRKKEESRKKDRNEDGFSLTCDLNNAHIQDIVAIGSSTGGIQIIEQILKDLPSATPPILIVQHMPAGFIASMANRINALCSITVKEAIDGEVIKPNTAYIAKGDMHMCIKKAGADYKILLFDGMKISHHKPSVDVLFNSFAKEVAGNNIKAFILTGMGHDGAAGIKAIKNKGGRTYAQDEASCTVYGMPKEAIKLNAIDRSLRPEEMARHIVGR